MCCRSSRTFCLRSRRGGRRCQIVVALWSPQRPSARDCSAPSAGPSPEPAGVPARAWMGAVRSTGVSLPKMARAGWRFKMLLSLGCSGRCRLRST
eukprot:6723584-Alexandrium_andersonii.AAC.1